MRNKNKAGRLIDKLYGGLNMGWPMVFAIALGAALLTAVFLVVPVFKNTSFARMGVTFEAWIFLAVIIMANCKKPLESALKTFVFFLVSQPLIYLFQVPFSYLGWQLFGYYKYWFILTLFTFPAAFIGWYITKKNWLSLLILAPVLAFLGYFVYESGTECVSHFPHLLVTMLFCILQIALYVVVFLPDIKQRLIGILIPVIAVIAIASASPQVNLTQVQYLPNEASFSSDATIFVNDKSIADIYINSPEEGAVYVYAHKYGRTDFTITDSGREYSYTLEVYDDNGNDQIKISCE